MSIKVERGVNFNVLLLVVRFSGDIIAGDANEDGGKNNKDADTERVVNFSIFDGLSSP